MPTPLILIKHDWTSPVVERIEFLTSVLVSANKREQRAGKRQFPRRGYEMQYLLSGEKLHEFRAMLSQSTARQAEVPLWHMGCQIIGYNAFTNVLTLDRPYGFKIGTTTRLLILYQDGSYQVVTAAGFTDQTNLILSLDRKSVV